MAAKIFWAKTRGGETRSVLQVLPGLDCNCVCAYCGTDLEAINPDNLGKVRPHFRHYELPEQGACSEAAARLGFQRALEKLPRIRLPERGFKPAETPQVRGVEFRDETLAVLELEDGRKLLIWLSASGSPTIDQSAQVGALRLDVSRIEGNQSIDDLLKALETGRLHLSWIAHWKDINRTAPDAPYHWEVEKANLPPARLYFPQPAKPTRTPIVGDRLTVVLGRYLTIYPMQTSQWNAVASHILQGRAQGLAPIPEEIVRATGLSLPTVERFLKSVEGQ